MQLERHECTVASAAALVCGPAHENEHGLKLGATARLLARSLRGKAPGGFGNGDGRPARQSLAVLKPDLQLDPDRERVHANMATSAPCRARYV
jgi:hypothetical protein